MKHAMNATEAERTELLALTKAAWNARNDVMHFTGARMRSDYNSLQVLRHVWHTCKAIGTTTTARDLGAAVDACEAVTPDLDDGLLRAFAVLETRLRAAAGDPSDDDGMAICEHCARHGIEARASLRSQLQDWAGDDAHPYLCIACDD